MTEEQFLNAECRRAEAGIKETAKTLGREALDVVDPRRLTREHPWKLVAVAAAAGFVASKILIHEAEKPNEPPEKPDLGTPDTPSKPPARKRLFTLSRILAVSREILTVARPILDTVWAAALAAAEGGHRGNGEHLAQTPSDQPPDSPSRS